MRLLLPLLLCLIAATSWSQPIERYAEYEDYAAALRPDSEQLYVVNYWATWCGPCVKEMPFFEELGEKHKDIEVVLVSIDFANQYDKRLLPFIEKQDLNSRIIHMADPKPNDWIDKVDPSWSGAIPATVFYQGDKKLFLEKEFPNYEALEKALINFQNK